MSIIQEIKEGLENWQAVVPEPRELIKKRSMKNKIEYKIVDMYPLYDSKIGLVPIIESSDGKRYVPNSLMPGVWVEEI